MENIIILESVIGLQVTGMDCEAGERVIAIVSRERAQALQAIIDDANDRLAQGFENVEAEADQDWIPIVTKREFFQKEA